MSNADTLPGKHAAAENDPTAPPVDQIVHGDSVALLNRWRAGWADLCFADPPFNIGYLYHGYDDQKDVDEYLDFSRQWMKAVHRALKPGGSFYLAIGDEFAADLCVIARREIGFHLRNWIVWHYTFGQQTRKKFAKSHTHILYFSKHKPDSGLTNITFNADAVRVASARQTTYADARANPKGKLPDDVWFLRPQEATVVEPGYRTLLDALPPKNADSAADRDGDGDGDAQEPPLDYFDPRSDTWFISRVCGTFREREGWHGCQMPVGVLNRIVQASSNEGDVVLDPFNGSGTTAVSAALLRRRYVGIDQSQKYVAFARQRLEHALAAAAAGNDGHGDAAKSGVIRGVVLDGTRQSRRMTETDAFGRKRVPRKKAGRRAVQLQR